MSDRGEEFKILDHPGITEFIFYPREDSFQAADDENMMSLLLPVEKGISISCVFYTGGRELPNILFFHGNGELASEYMDIAATFNDSGVNLFVADYRGYGVSGGSPTVSNMIKDANPIYAGFSKILGEKGFSGSRFIMGRSLGSASALEIVGSHPGEFKGVIIESGFCDVTDLLARIGIPLPDWGKGGMARSPGFERVEKITMPALIIHGAHDSIVPLAEGEKIFRYIGSKDKRMAVIPDADHNTIFMVGMKQYLKELSDFIEKYK